MMNSQNDMPTRVRIGEIQFSELGRNQPRYLLSRLTLAIPAFLLLFGLALRTGHECYAAQIPSLFDQALGDLNGDGRPDRASIIQKHEKGEESIKRILTVELSQPRGWKKILETRCLTPSFSLDYVLREELFPPSVTIQDGTLSIHDGITKCLNYELKHEQFVLKSFLDIDHSRVSDWFELYELHLDVGTAVHEYDPPSNLSDREPPTWCDWAAQADVKCRYPQVPVVFGEEGKFASKLVLFPISSTTVAETPLVTSWARVSGRSLHICFRLAFDGATSFQPSVKNLKGQRLTPVSWVQRRDPIGMYTTLEFRPGHFGLEEDWCFLFEDGPCEDSSAVRKTPVFEDCFLPLEVPCELEVTGTTQQGAEWSVTSNPNKARHAAPFVLMPAFVLKLPCH